MRSLRAEFSKPVKAAAFIRCGGFCECCALKIIGTPVYDHFPIPASMQGPATLENCRVLCSKCNKTITFGKGIDSNTQIAKSTRLAEKRLGLRPKSRGFRGSRKFDGTVKFKT